ncbi:HTH-type transcriptional regulator/antitoxin HigA [Parabacteroides sp. PF5-5]|uniref:helix-turn-helix domain-containing protein n=1 Tax=unclassified Parabacteroides TaxID=2649774 RepID=UPI0024772CC0|nr:MULTISPECIES: helix-turn-helix domain-containing protein [unclassified Parabacteroides]MDH6303894.1 HTH-type transcriptional regulator/antitoxin HigA [Parabacteroides sp. PH5-39]MDH6314511.1 HTH-type transcriptional regulator/antitoxin HigA [Parabacteroides sp. PF5-13]MDH6318424.1 HTH-type transcriptional regulator/antitoxin HigA [Parabacteroides sp. PH5-13]MDH6322283.1 HTH-type transcriptional regulator/antitoxin HigA [Parabacteroides sp. PH5-8]MDH6325637.1 HTH-type transcriptional regulat
MMGKQFENITEIKSRDLYNKVKAYVNTLIDEATANGALTTQGADNDYTHEIGHLGALCADYENHYITYKNIKVKSPLLISIENEMEKRSINQRQAAELLDVKESTFSQIMTGQRSVSMKMAKKLYKIFNIDSNLILEYS